MAPQRLLSKPCRSTQDTQQLATGSLAIEALKEILCPGFRDLQRMEQFFVLSQSAVRGVGLFEAADDRRRLPSGVG